MPNENIQREIQPDRETFAATNLITLVTNQYRSEGNLSEFRSDENYDATKALLEAVQNKYGEVWLVNFQDTLGYEEDQNGKQTSEYGYKAGMKQYKGERIYNFNFRWFTPCFDEELARLIEDYQSIDHHSKVLKSLEKINQRVNDIGGYTAFFS